jgi:hypothetical protein
VLKGYVLIIAIGANTPCRFRRKTKERLDGT